MEKNICKANWITLRVLKHNGTNDGWIELIGKIELQDLTQLYVPKWDLVLGLLLRERIDSERWINEFVIQLCLITMWPPVYIDLSTWV